MWDFLKGWKERQLINALINLILMINSCLNAKIKVYIPGSDSRNKKKSAERALKENLKIMTKDRQKRKKATISYEKSP